MLRYADSCVKALHDPVCTTCGARVRITRAIKRKKRREKESTWCTVYTHLPRLFTLPSLRDNWFRSRDELPEQTSDDNARREGCCCNTIARQMCTVSAKTLSRSSREFTRFERRRNHVRYSAVFNHVARSLVRKRSSRNTACWIHSEIKLSISFELRSSFD